MNPRYLDNHTRIPVFFLLQSMVHQHRGRCSIVQAAGYSAGADQGSYPELAQRPAENHGNPLSLDWFKEISTEHHGFDLFFYHVGCPVFRISPKHHLIQ